MLDEASAKDFINLVILNDLLTPLDTTKKIKPTEWIIEGMIARGDVTLVIGPPKGGKSWLWLRAACELSIGGTFLGGFSKVNQSRVLYFMFDNVGESKVIERVKKANWNYDNENLKIVYNEYVRSHNATIDLDKPESLFGPLIERHDPDVVIIDTLGSSHDKNENKNEEMKPLIEKLIAIARDKNIGIVILHHTRKRKSSESSNQMSSDDSVGAGIMLRIVSTIIGVSKSDDAGTHRVKCLDSWHKIFFPFEFSLIDEVDSSGNIRVNMPIKLSLDENLSARDRILKVIMDLYWACDPFTRQDIEKRTGFGHQTVSEILNQLVNENILESSGKTNNKTFFIPITKQDSYKQLSLREG